MRATLMYAAGDGDQSYFDGIVILGLIEGDLDTLAQLDGDIDVQIRRLDGNQEGATP